MCRCVPVHILCIRIPTYLVLVNRPYTCVDRSWSSFIARGEPKHGHIRHFRSDSWHGHDLRHALILVLTSNISSCTKLRARHLRFTQLPSAFPVLIFIRPNVTTSGSLLPIMCLISSRVDRTLKSQFVMSNAPADETDTEFSVWFFAILIAFSRNASFASCVVTATACSASVDSTETLLGTCCSVVSIARLSSHGFLFVLLLQSDPDELGCHCLPSSPPVSPATSYIAFFMKMVLHLQSATQMYSLSLSLICPLIGFQKLSSVSFKLSSRLTQCVF